MPERYCGKVDRAEWGFKGTAYSPDRILALLAEKERKIAEITACPGPCADGLVPIELHVASENGEKIVQQAACPVLGPGCAYGLALRGQIDRHLAGLMIAKVGVPRRHVSRFDRYTDTIAAKEATRWGVRGFLVLSGKTGCGKSYAAAWFVREHLKGRIGDPYKAEAREWHMRAESAASCVTWSGAQGIVEDKSIAGGAKRVSLLILDDLGKESELPSARAIVRDVISQRYDNELPTIVTTELTLSDIAARYGRAVVERVIGEAEDGGRFVTCGDVSLRLIDRRHAA